MRTNAQGLITVSFFVNVTLGLFVSMDRDNTGEPTARFPGRQRGLETNP